MLKTIEIHGHRGDSGHVLENTLLSFASAIEAGADAIEMDLRLSKDGKVVIHHDSHIHFHSLSNLTLEELKPIPTLEEVFELVLNHPKGKRVRLNLEIKREPEDLPNILAEQIVNLVNKWQFSSRVYYSSFDLEVLAEVRKREKKARLLYLYSSESPLSAASQLQVEILGPDEALLKKREDIQFLKQQGFRVIAWTVNKPDRWKELIEWGIDGIITDYPQELIAFQRSL